MRIVAIHAISALAAEALLLGMVTGPVCAASCGPVVVPWLLTQRQGFRLGARQLSFFLLARCAGYLIFAAAAWLAGSTLQRPWSRQTWLFATVQLLLAAALLVYGVGWPRRGCHPALSSQALVQIGTGPPGRSRQPLVGAGTLGLLTGLSVCPPFLVAGVRAAQLPRLPLALLFFAAFFIGTSAWFAPLLAFGFLRRSPAIEAVARMTACLLALHYGFLGLTALFARIFHG